MAMSAKLDLRQSQTLVMTPQLQQAIKLLQLSNIELAAFVEQELERNPLLERGQPDADTGEAPADQVADAPADNGAAATELSGTEQPASEPAEGGDDIAEGSYDSSPLWQGSMSGGRFDGEDLAGVEQTIATTASLYDHLARQIYLEITEPAERIAATYLLDLLDEAGYLVGDLDEAARHLGCTRAFLDRVVDKVQHFDPPGIFARDLKECLALQLADLNRLDPAMQALLDNLELVAKRDMAELKKCCGCSEDDIADMLGELKALDPKPGLAFDAEPSQTVIPDVNVRPKQGGGWQVELNSDTLPKVLTNQRYYAEISGGARNKADKEFLAEKWNSANWLVKALDQRARTILRVAREIVRQQDLFLIKGVEHLRPLVLRDIAEVLELHESTVSRVTSNKYMATPRGIFELKYFFTASIGSTGDGPAHSAEAVRHRIKALIDAEPPDKVLSDDGLVEILKADGIDIARRTVAKYRESMRIPSSVQRRRDKKIQAKSKS
ncbi:MAG: RNA polymerase factor sigma-54 [Pseudomonadota bacterium]